MTVRLISPAEDELAEAVSFYESRRSGLGLDFLDEFESAVSRLRGRPEAWKVFAPGFRRCLFQRFPYGLVYAVREPEIIIVAVMHLHKMPGYWAGRL